MHFGVLGGGGGGEIRAMREMGVLLGGVVFSLLGFFGGGFVAG